MDIVSTGMHNAGNLGLKREIIFFLHRERVDVRAQGDALAGLSALYLAHKARGLKEAVGDAHLVELLGDALCGAELLKACLRVAVKVAAHLHDVGIDLMGQLLDVSHSVLLPRGTRPGVCRATV